WATTVANLTTAGSGDQSPRDGSSAAPSPRTGRRTASASSSAAAEMAAGCAAQASTTARKTAPRVRRRTRRHTSGRRLFAFDRRLGARLVAGADEAGRGCLAGPLVAAGVLFDHESLTPRELRALGALNDSKQHTWHAREQLFPLVLRSATRGVVVARCVRG